MMLIILGLAVYKSVVLFHCGGETERDLRRLATANENSPHPVGKHAIEASAQVVLSSRKSIKLEVAISVSVRRMRMQAVRCLDHHLASATGFPCESIMVPASVPTASPALDATGIVNIAIKVRSGTSRLMMLSFAPSPIAV